MLNKMYIHEYKDQFNIYNLIKKINKNFKLCFDSKNKFFIILNSANHDEICLKFDAFNLNIEKILKETSITNSQNLFKKIDEDNRRLEEKQQSKQLGRISDSLSELERYTKRATQILPSDINKILGVNYD